MSNDADRDLVFGEDVLKKFTSAFQIDAYTKNVNDYQGEKDMFSKFGLEIKSYVTVLISRRAYERRVPQQSFYGRPKEGDLVYVPWSSGQGELFEITSTNADADFFALGRKQPNYYELRLEKFKYSQEVINTGVPEIDAIPAIDGYIIQLELGAGSGNYKIKELVYQGSNVAYATASATVAGWDALNNYLKVTNITGEFDEAANVIGSVSGANYPMVFNDPQESYDQRDAYDNKVTRNEANTYISTSETNALGSL